MEQKSHKNAEIEAKVGKNLHFWGFLT